MGQAGPAGPFHRRHPPAKKKKDYCSQPQGGRGGRWPGAEGGSLGSLWRREPSEGAPRRCAVLARARAGPDPSPVRRAELECTRGPEAIVVSSSQASGPPPADLDSSRTWTGPSDLISVCAPDRSVTALRVTDPPGPFSPTLTRSHGVRRPCGLRRAAPLGRRRPRSAAIPAAQVSESGSGPRRSAITGRTRIRAAGRTRRGAE